MNKNNSELAGQRLLLHIAVLLFGFTAILGKLITLNAISLVFWRMVLALLLLWAIKVGTRSAFNPLSRREKLRFMGIGFIIAIHWFCFYASVKMAHVSVALICMALTPLFTSLIEPLLNKKPIDRIDLICSVLIVPLIYMLIGGIIGFSLPGFLIGILAAFFAALFSIMNKNNISVTDNDTLMLYEFSGVLILSAAVIAAMYAGGAITDLIPASNSDWIYIVLLSWVCTNIAFKLTVMAMKKVSVFETNLIIGLEPLYGILLAVFFFKEYRYFTFQFYLAAILILGLILYYPMQKMNRQS